MFCSLAIELPVSIVTGYAIVGAGAMGAAYAAMFTDAVGFNVCFVARGKRFERLKEKTFTVNEGLYRVPAVHADKVEAPADLVIAGPDLAAEGDFFDYARTVQLIARVEAAEEARKAAAEAKAETSLLKQGLERLKDDQFILTCSFHCPHVPITPSEPYASMYAADTMKTHSSIGDRREN